MSRAKMAFRTCFGIGVVTLVLLEISVRLFALDQRAERRIEYRATILPLVAPMLARAMIPDRRLFWRFLPGLADFNIGDARLSTDSNGFRKTVVVDAENSCHILALGDSCTFGVGLEDDRTWPSQLIQASKRHFRKDVSVYNAGVPGYTIHQGWNRLESVSGSIDIDLLVIQFGINDACNESGTDIQRERILVPTGIAKVLDVCRVAKIARLFFESTYLNLMMPPMSQAEFIRDPEGAILSAHERLPPRVSPDEFQEYLQRFETYSQESGIPLIVIVWPFSLQLNPTQENPDRLSAAYVPNMIEYQELARRSAERGAHVVDLLDVLRSHPDWAERFYCDRVHASSAGCAIVAELLAPIVASLCDNSHM